MMFVNLLTILFCVLSKNEAYWPVWFLVAFCGFYAVPSNVEQKEDTFQGFVIGTIASYVVLQGHAFVLRPYDQYRYVFFFRNANINAMFYLLVFIVCLAEVEYLIIHKSRIVLKIIFCYLACSAFSLTVLAECRSVISIMILLTAVSLIYSFVGFKKTDKIKPIKEMAIVLITFIIGIVSSFAAVRYMPSIFHHPIWFYGEYSEEKVHSFDSINSEKYYNPFYVVLDSFNRFKLSTMEEATNLAESRYSEEDGRVVYSFVNADENGDVLDILNSVNVSKIKEREGDRVISYADGTEPGLDSEHPVYVGENYTGIVGKYLRVREYIFMYYSQKISFWGNEKEYPVVWIVPSTAYDHCHNNIIELAYCFGVIPAVSYVLSAFGGIIIVVCSLIKNKEKVFSLFGVLAYISVFLLGMVECCTFGYYMIWWMFFSIPYFLVNNINKTKN